MEVMQNFIQGLWTFLVLSAPYLLLGFVLSGIVHVILPLSKIKQWLGSNRIRDIFYASALGVPLPLCSCGVIPAAVTLRKAGASNASVSSFLISTPESGIDSILVTYGLMDIPMTFFRPLSAFITATTAGLLNHCFNQDGSEPAAVGKPCCHTKKVEPQLQKEIGIKDFISKVFHFAFVELVDDIAVWMSVGILLGASTSVFIPDNFFLNLSPTTSRLAILLIGIPMYICASASTPIAASLVLKGMSPGVALILLLVGPATNVANIIVLQKHIGVKGTVINILSIGGCALGLSYLVDYYYQRFGAPHFKLDFLHDHSGVIDYLSAVILILILLASFYRIYFSKTKRKASHE